LLAALFTAARRASPAAGQRPGGARPVPLALLLAALFTAARRASPAAGQRPGGARPVVRT